MQLIVGYLSFTMKDFIEFVSNSLVHFGYQQV